MSAPRDLDEEDRQDELYYIARQQITWTGEFRFRERTTEQGDANKPVVTRLREAGYTVTFEPTEDAHGGFWVVTK